MRQTKKTNLFVIAIFIVGLLIGIIVFGYTVFTSFVKPFFLDEPKKTADISLSTLLDETASYIAERGDLTLSSPSATLTIEEEKFTAEVINASGVPNAAQTLADSLGELSITVSRIGNSADPVDGNVLSLKSKASLLRESLVAKISTDSANVRVETLAESFPFDIRIVIGR